MGNGDLEKFFIPNLAAQFPALCRLEVVGIDLCPAGLQIAREAVHNAGSEAGITVTFTPICNFMEKIPAQDWRDLGKKKTIVLASLALHHVDPTERRTVLSTIAKEVNPSAMIIVEGHVNHASSSLVERFLSSWSHYSMVWEIIDNVNDLKPNVVFFLCFWD